MKMKYRIASLVPQGESPLRHLPLVDLLVDTKTELLELALRSGLKVFTSPPCSKRIAPHSADRGRRMSPIGRRAERA